MTDETFVFKQTPSLEAFAAKLETTKGTAALYEVETQFASLVDVLHHTQQHNGEVTIHVPNGDEFSFTHLTKAQFTHLAIEVGNAIGAKL